ncbi:MAG: hypothetical protein F2573_02655 [Actinobacteria bacterium]|uniref:Unannotated protein n=1 Tax=freshwater metagenome TaxID=449393 RepID=A0A6J6FHR9_9ZZZZ|nr:hypothetical protein [Actinomycetota bacterium]
MKNLWQQADKRIALALGLVIIGLVISLLAPRATQVKFGGRVVDATYPATVCPGGVNNAVSVAYLPNPKVAVRSVKKASVTLRPARTYRYALTTPLFVDGNPQSILAANTSSGWLASTVCTAGSGDSWFVGGSAGISSAGYIDLINSGLSESTVDLLAYSANGPLPLQSIVIPANTEKKIYLDSLAPGEEKIAVHAITRAGRVTAYFIDIRKKGLRSLGADYVAPADEASKQVVLPGAINSVRKGVQLDQDIRLLVPGAADATVSGTIYSVDGAFVPIGLDNLRLPHGKVVEIALSKLTVSTPFALVLNSDQPIVAGMVSQTKLGTSDFAWSGAASELPEGESYSINMGGHLPLLSFYGNGKISIQIDYNLTSGKSRSVEVQGDRKVSWRPEGAVNRIEIRAKSSGIFGGILFSGNANSGLSYMPLRAGATLQNSVLPQADARVISRGSGTSANTK